MKYVAVLIAAYLVGSIPSGLLVARSAGIRDIRQHGSGNIGATNVLRTLGWKHGLAVLALDAAKGSCGVLLARWAGTGQIGQTLGGMAAMTGHLVLTTLHTNDAASAIARLRTLGVDPDLLAGSINCIVSQRLAQ